MVILFYYFGCDSNITIVLKKKLNGISQFKLSSRIVLNMNTIIPLSRGVFQRSS